MKQVKYTENKKIIKVGNSKGVMLRPKILEVLNLDVGSILSVTYNFKDGKIILEGINNEV